VLALLHLISEVPVSNLDPQAGYPTRDILWFAAVAVGVRPRLPPSSSYPILSSQILPLYFT
jgi:hypothetical protein